MRTIVVVHGRGKKPNEVDKTDLICQSLKHGLGRAGVDFEDLINGEQLKIDVAYYGHICNILLKDNAPHPRDLSRDFLAIEPEFKDSRSYYEGLRVLFDRRDRDQSEDFYDELRKNHGFNSSKDGWIKAGASIGAILKLNKKILKQFADTRAYFDNPIVREEILQVVEQRISSAWSQGDSVCLIAHSMGTWVAYDALWRLRNMPQYREHHDRTISQFITLGSPLGEHALRKMLLGWENGPPSRFPDSIKVWDNFSAKDDLVSESDDELANDFIKVNFPVLITDHDDHHTFNLYGHKQDNKFKLNPHKLYGYLDNKGVAEVVARWIKQSG